jgi:hypothetical protein
MRLYAAVWVNVLFAAALSFGQAASMPAQASSAAAGHGAFPVKVTKTLDSSKLKEDDSIEVETAGSFKLPDGTLVPKGSKLLGHVTAAKARSKGDSDSELTLAFDKLNILGGKQLALRGIVRAIFPPGEESAGPNMSTMGTSAGGSAGGAALGAASQAGGVGITDTHNDTPKSQAVTDVKATGVQGMHDLQLENGVVTSKGKSVKLNGGVRMVVQVDILG